MKGEVLRTSPFVLSFSLSDNLVNTQQRAVRGGTPSARLGSRPSVWFAEKRMAKHPSFKANRGHVLKSLT